MSCGKEKKRGGREGKEDGREEGPLNQEEERARRRGEDLGDQENIYYIYFIILISFYSRGQRQCGAPALVVLLNTGEGGVGGREEGVEWSKRGEDVGDQEIIYKIYILYFILFI